MAVVTARLVRWTVRRLGMRNLLALALLLAILASTVTGLETVVRGFDPWLAWILGALGLLAGWGLATTTLAGWQASLLVAASGLAVVLVRVGRLGRMLIALPPRVGELGAAAGVLLARVGAWVAGLVAGEPTFDPAAAAFVWGLALWGVGAWAGWSVRRRHRPLQAVAPAGLLLMAALSYVWSNSTSVLIFLGATLSLLALWAYDVRVRHWQEAGVDFPEIDLETAMVAVFLVSALMATATVTPSLSVRRIIELAEQAVGPSERVETLAEALGMEQRGTGFDELRAGGLPRSHLLGAGPELSREVVMIVSTGDLPPGLPEAGAGTPPYYRWRSYTYERYTGSGWLAGEAEIVEYEAGEPALAAIPAGYRVLRQSVEIVGERGDLLYTAGALVVADRDYAVAWRSEEDPFAAMIEATRYRADSLLPLAGVEELRSAGSDYPRWVQRYLSPPDSVPERVLSLARDLTATEPTPYDRAVAIEAYLRGFPYDLDVPLPPPGRDVVDYFLFDLQRGYCDYYSTAMVMLARAAGLPARQVVGYSAGRYDYVNARYVVSEANAHAWVEVYFPGYGWIEFEPTANQPRLERAAQGGATEWPEPEGALEPEVGGWRAWRWPGRPLALLALLALPILVVVSGVVYEEWRLRRMRPTAALVALYGRLRGHGRRLAVPMEAGDTPHEFAASLAGKLAGVMQGRRWGGAMLTAAGREVGQLIELYVLANYSARPPGAAGQLRALRIWGRLRWRLWLAWAWQRLRRVREMGGV